MELKITTEKVQAGAVKCPQAAEVLKKMFPEAFVAPPVLYGTFIVMPKSDTGPFPVGRKTAIAHPAMVGAYAKAHNYQAHYVVVVLTGSIDAKPNGWSYGTWEEFHKAWKLV